MKEKLKSAWDAAVKEAVMVQEKGFNYKPDTFEDWFNKQYPKECIVRNEHQKFCFNNNECQRCLK